MEFDIEKVGGIGEFTKEKKAVGRAPDVEEVEIYRVLPEKGSGAADVIAAADATATADAVANADAKPKVFLVVRKNTIEVRTDGKLRDLLRERYESVMESRYFGRGGVEIVNSGQISASEINDLVRLSYQLTENAK